ncbi:MAG: hypothetical protein ACREAU_00675 [Nitrosopumilaceae archaeon]
MPIQTAAILLIFALVCFMGYKSITATLHLKEEVEKRNATIVEKYKF